MTLEHAHSLRNHEFVRGLAETQLAALASLAREVHFAEDQLILEDGQRSAAFYLLVSGSVAVELRSPRYVVCVQALGPGHAFGWSALLDQQDTLFQVRARESTLALRLDGAGLKSLCRTDPVLAAEIYRRTLHLVARRVKATELRFAEMCGIRV